MSEVQIVSSLAQPIKLPSCFSKQLCHFWGLPMKLRLLAVLVLLTTIGVVPGAESKRPNFIFILADDLGWSDLGCYGHPQLKTPNLDRLAKQGTLFTQF